MKIQIHIKNSNIIGWNTGSGSNIIGIIRQDFEITNEQWGQIQNGYEPKLQNNELIIEKSNWKLNKEIKEKEKQDLKIKFQNNNFTNEDIKKLADLML